MKKSFPSEYCLNDLTGNWDGQARSRNYSIHLHLYVDEKGDVVGSGVHGNWGIDSKGTVEGGGTFVFMDNNRQLVVRATWDMKLDQTRTMLSGDLIIAYSYFMDLHVKLKKRRNDALPKGRIKN